MSTKHPDPWSRRRFLAGTSVIGLSSVLSIPREVLAEPQPETRSIRFLHAPAICVAPQYLAEALLRLEGFTEIEYVAPGRAGARMLLPRAMLISPCGTRQAQCRRLRPVR